MILNGTCTVMSTDLAASRAVVGKCKDSNPVGPVWYISGEDYSPGAGRDNHPVAGGIWCQST